jgi:hypothetical protein
MHGLADVAGKRPRFTRQQPACRCVNSGEIRVIGGFPSSRFGGARFVKWAFPPMEACR